MERFGFVGLPNAGKSSLYNALAGGGALAAPYAFATVDPNVGVAKVPDDRLQRLAIMSQTKSIVPASVQFVDIAGLVEGAAQGEGLGNRFLAHIREVDAIVFILRAFIDMMGILASTSRMDVAAGNKPELLKKALQIIQQIRYLSVVTDLEVLCEEHRSGQISTETQNFLTFSVQSAHQATDLQEEWGVEGEALQISAAEGGRVNAR